MYLMKQYPNELDDESMTPHGHFNALKFVSDLCTYGPVELRRFLPDIGELKPMPKPFRIPLTQTEIFRVRASRANDWTLAGNMETTCDLLRQGGVGRGDDDTLDEVLVDDHAVFHNEAQPSIEMLEQVMTFREFEDSLTIHAPRICDFNSRALPSETGGCRRLEENSCRYSRITS